MSLTTILVWIIIAAIVGFVGEFITGRRVPEGIIGAIILGFIAIFLVNDVLHVSINGEPRYAGVPLITSIIAAAILVFLWSAFAYHRVYRPYRERYYRRERRERRPERRRRRYFR